METSGVWYRAVAMKCGYNMDRVQGGVTCCSDEERVRYAVWFMNPADAPRNTYIDVALFVSPCPVSACPLSLTRRNGLTMLA